MTYPDTHFFLGANTDKGFFSLYDQFNDPLAGNFLYVLKGGPGCGKSTFMKTIAQNMHNDGLTIEYIHCSGDPGSLDGVYFPEIKTAFVDGTAPHVIEPPFTGSAGAYINIGQFYDTDALKSHLNEIMDVTAAYKSLYTKAYACLAGAGTVSGRFMSSFLTDSVVKSISKRAAGIVDREFKKSKRSEGKVTQRFISAISCDGFLHYFDTIDALTDRIYILENNFGLAPYMLEILKDHAVLRGYDIIECLSPLSPEIPEHLIIPELSLGFVTQTSKSPCPLKPTKHIRLDAMIDRFALRRIRPKLKRSKRIYDMLIDEALENLSDAGRLHDELEKIYNPHVDFNGVMELANEYIDRLRKL